jgi:hypothetical protein
METGREVTTISVHHHKLTFEELAAGNCLPRIALSQSIWKLWSRKEERFVVELAG